MAEKNIKVGQKVEITGKNIKGKVAYVGMTNFAVGKWVGLILDEPKGKNNGTLKGQKYFTCQENYGMFVRPTQLTVIGGGGNITGSSSEDIADAPTKPSVTRSRLSGSRQSLSSSRQSLLGSRSQLSSSISEKISESSSSANKLGRKSMLVQPSNRTSLGPPLNPSSSADGEHIVHRSSFVETGFLEILTPQFTPSQPMRSPSFNAIEERTHSLEQQKIIDELKNQISDLTEKLETVKQRRLEDKERYRDFDKMKIQFEQLQEFKSKIMDAQASLQRDLQRAKQETKDAIEAKERHADEMADLSDNIELITLDKEMAEEKADTLQLELESAKERIEELSVDLELLRDEMSNKAESVVGTLASGDGGVSLVYQIKQLEQQNHRLKETLLRLRDLSAHDKHDIQKMSKELETKKSEVLELERTKEKFSTKIDELEATIADLQEQVDAALGAEEMVEQLAEKKMELEEKLKGLEEEIKELEQLEEIHEQLIESNHDLEMDLREELDMAHAAKKDMQRERDAAIETIYDRDQTVNKFRELVLKLNEQAADMREKSNVGNGSQHSDQQIVTTESVDYNQMFAETKAYTRAIDVQLRQIELTQANERVQMLSSYMPDSFMSRGGDNDSILVVLLVSRIVFKTEIIVTQTRERFPAVDLINKDVVFQGHSVQQYAFKSFLLHYIHNLQCVMHQILYGLNSCKPDTLLRAGSSLPEMIAQEKSVDSIIELLKSNQLDENSSTDGIEKCVSFFNAMNSVLLAGEADDLINEMQLLRDSTAAINSACEAILTDANTSRCIIGGGNETSTDLILLVQFIIENVEAIKQQVKLVKRRLPQDPHVVKCGMQQRTLENIRSVTASFSKIMSSLHLAVKQALVVCSPHENGEDTENPGISNNKFWELLSNACEHVYEQDDLGPMQFKTILQSANSELTQFAQYLLDKEYDIIAAATNQSKQKPYNATAPILLRSQIIKKQLEQKNVIASTLENREAEIKQMKLAAKMKQEELSEMQIRKGLAEKKLSVLQNEHDSKISDLEKKFEETSELLHKKEKEFEYTMDHLQNDINSLESERSSLREKLKTVNTKRGIVHSESEDLNLTSSIPSTSIASAPYVAEEMNLMKSLLIEERNKRLKIQANEMKNKLKMLEPIFVPKPRDRRIIELENELNKMKHDWLLGLIAINPEKDTLKQIKNCIELKAKTLASEVLKEYLIRNPHRAAQSDFSQFPTVEITKKFNLI